MRGKQTLKRRASKLRRSDALMVSAYNARNQPDGLLVQRGCSSKRGASMYAEFCSEHECFKIA